MGTPLGQVITRNDCACGDSYPVNKTITVLQLDEYRWQAELLLRCECTCRAVIVQTGGGEHGNEARESTC